MKPIIEMIPEKCQCCTKCIRVCPVKEANIVYIEKGKIKVHIDQNKCIACGACLEACNHNARYYNDDTERFFKDLQIGEPISLVVAPTFCENFDNWESVLAWFKTQGAAIIADVSLGIDICTWASIRFIEQNKPTVMITQPCPPIVEFIEKYCSQLLNHVSPVQSPILCTSIFLKKTLGLPGRIAALTPCPAKTNEFRKTNVVSYNVTFKKLGEHLKTNEIKIPQASFEFDNIDCSLIRSCMIGGLTESIRRHMTVKYKVYSLGGRRNVYRYLELVSDKKPELPKLLDALNCIKGCSHGAGCNIKIAKHHGVSSKGCQEANVCDSEQNQLYSVFDQRLQLSDFMK